MRKSRPFPVVLGVAPPILLAATFSLLCAAPPSAQKTAQPPTWEEVESRVFFKDAFSKLVGERPDYKNLKSANSTPSGETPDGSPPANAEWSKLVSRETLEDEVKSYVTTLAEDIDVPARFTAGGYRKVRRHFTALAVVFAIISRYDKDVRWKEQAAGLREAFARAGFNAKAGSENVYNEAKARKADLTDLVRGGSVNVPNADASASWDKVADLAPLMSRFELGFEKRLQPWVASEAQFQSNLEQIKHEAELLAALAHVISQEGFELADDEEYQKFARQLETAAAEIARATQSSNHAAAQKAAGQIQLSCTNCHGDFR
jgi:hypothetical protein